MTTKIGIGFSNQTNSYRAAIEAARMAMELRGIERPDFALIFCSGKHNTTELMKGLNEILPAVPKIGGSAYGVIANEFLGYDGFEVGVTIFSSDTIRFEIFAQPDINKGEYTAGCELGKQIKAAAQADSKALLVFYDSSKQQNPPMLNFATYLFKGLEEYLPPNLVCAGGGFLSDMQLNTCYQFFNEEVFSQNAVAVLISGNCKMETTILHGCKPCSPYLTITKAEGSIIYEIDDRPALDVIDELLGTGHGMNWKDFTSYVILGVNHGDQFGDFDEKAYVNKVTLAVNEDNKSLIMFEPDLQDGVEVQLMTRSVDLNYIATNVQDTKERIGNKNPIFSFYIDCAGRVKPFSGTDFEEAAEVQKVIGNEIPFMGFYSGVEVAKVGPNLQPLDWTGVLCMFGE